MRRIALLFVAVVVLAGCRIDTVLHTRINAPDGVERHPPTDVAAVACDFDSFWFGPGVALIHADGSSDSFLFCTLPAPFNGIPTDLSAPGTAADGTIYVGATDPTDISGNSSQILALNPGTGSATSIVFTPGRLIRSVTVGPGGEIFHGSAPLAGSFGIFRVSGSSSVEVPGTEGLGLYDFAFDVSGNIYASAGHQVVKVTPAGVRSVVAGNGTSGFSGDGGAATAAQLNSPAGVDVDPQGRVLIADTGNNRVRRVGVNGNIRTVAGNGTSGFSGDVGLATSAMLSSPLDVAVDTGDEFWIADTGNGRVRHVGLP